MREKIETSKELRDRIIRDEILQRDLSEKVAEILNGKVKIEEDEAYTFVPIVYEKPVFAPEILAGPANVAASRMYAIGSKYSHGWPWWWPWWIGLPAPEFLRILEELRLWENDPTPEPAIPLGEQIVRNRDLLRDLAEGVSEILTKHGVVVSEDVMYVFSPMVYKRPIFAHELFTGVHAAEFAPETLAGPTPQPSAEVAAKLLAVERIAIPWHDIGPIDGIPAPEIFYALEKFSRIRG
ncbi:MAG: hypothetical protein ACXQTR_04115 [Candidatus Methanospirareceae archaeon]